ncbi:hypothetical protein [Saccharothrix coeruleofusca]|uniref:Uncharacterized protein n=1 Tax=Saccharothrix coeruleofusca TaxID=33919 RepID=A0A918EFU9_9PSEU|nr:hypothetical protein [Saccharothrix coeruleofusca]GGP63635.1 hypothetical protein GCM10010185_40430 [Saccharothrix coeruleofusca]
MDEQRHVEEMEKLATTRKWVVPAHLDHGPVTVELAMPEVRVTDSQGRFIVITPGQAELVGRRLDDAATWMSQQ